MLCAKAVAPFLSALWLNKATLRCIYRQIVEEGLNALTQRSKCRYSKTFGLNELGRRLLGFTGARCSVLIIGSHKGRKAITLCNLGPF